MEPVPVAQNISTFFSKIKKGSKPFRLITERLKGKNFDNTNLRCVNTLARLTDTTIPVSPHLNNCLAHWQSAYMTNDTRNFLFTLRNNDLRLNNRLNAYDNDIDARCTFCRILDSNTNARDGLNHAFFLCPTTKFFLGILIQKCEPVPDMDTRDFRQLYWYGSEATEEEEDPYTPYSNSGGLLVFDLFRYTIWKFRSRRRVPNEITFFREFNFSLKLCTLKNKRAGEILAGNNMFANFLPARG